MLYPIELWVQPRRAKLTNRFLSAQVISPTQHGAGRILKWVVNAGAGARSVPERSAAGLMRHRSSWLRELEICLPLRTGTVRAPPTTSRSTARRRAHLDPAPGARPFRPLRYPNENDEATAPWPPNVEAEQTPRSRPLAIGGSVNMRLTASSQKRAMFAKMN